MGTRALPDDAYRYCKGETIEHALGYPIRATRPLDFAAVTDHAEYLGVPRHVASINGEEEFKLRRVLNSGNRLRISFNSLKTVLGKMESPESRDASFGGEEYKSVSRSAWQDIVASAEQHNSPGRFTTFIAYEWTSMPDSQNLHRNVIYRGSQALTSLSHPSTPRIPKTCGMPSTAKETAVSRASRSRITPMSATV